MKPTQRSPFTRRLKPSSEALACRVYVIELDESVLQDPAFVRANPRYRAGQPCLYVGMTSLSPEERY